jgi:hypothetical protein
MKNIHLISTDKPSRLYLHSNNELQLRTNIIRTSEDYLGTNQNIYITNSEEIKEGDWCYDKVLNLIFQTDNHTDFKYANQTDNVLKIILTTDQDLIKDGVQSIDDEFLEWFVKNPSCEMVQTIYGLFNPIGRQVDPMNLGQNHSQCVWKYKIIIPQEEPKQETIKEALREYVIYNFDSSLLDIDDHEEKVIAFAKWMHDYKADINKVYELFEQFKKK